MDRRDFFNESNKNVSKDFQLQYNKAYGDRFLEQNKSLYKKFNYNIQG